MNGIQVDTNVEFTYIQAWYAGRSRYAFRYVQEKYPFRARNKTEVNQDMENR